MTELEEVAQAIYEQHEELFPIRYRYVAICIAKAELGEGEPQQVIDGVADALMEFKKDAN